jgi:hypothetical protein
MQKIIIVAGYPKSGNTWLTRLVAELVQCPISGFWDSTHHEIAKEGESRESDYVCYKAHQTYERLKDCEDWSQDCSIIYIIRDPRDVAISGANYFRFYRSLLLYWFRRHCLPIERYFYHLIYKPLFASENSRIARMARALAFGEDALLSKWCGVSWREHCKSYSKQGILFVRYEDLLLAPHRQATIILDNLGLSRSEESIAAAVKAQSFAVKRSEFKAKKQQLKARYRLDDATIVTTGARGSVSSFCREARLRL